MKRKLIQSFALRANAILCFVSLMFTAVAQDTAGYWKWFRSYMGHEQNTPTYKNRIITMETDDEGNVYCFGFFGSDACWGNSPSEGCVAEELGSQVVSLGTYNLLIAKFDTLGNRVWHRIISLNGYNRLYPAAMELRDGQIYDFIVTLDLDGQVLNKIFIGVWGIDGTFIDTIPLQVDRVHQSGGFRCLSPRRVRRSL